MATPNKNERRTRRHGRVRAKVRGTAARPRLSVFRSAHAVYAQLIDDAAGATLAQADSRSVAKGTGVARARAVGVAVAKQAVEKGVAAAVFDRGGFLYTGRVKALAEGAREGGLTL